MTPRNPATQLSAYRRVRSVIGRFRRAARHFFVVLWTWQWSERTATWFARIQTRNPRTYLEKSRYKMARDRRPILGTFADKLAVRDYVRERIGESVLNDVYVAGNDTRVIDWQLLPEEFVIKMTHGCRGIIVVSRKAARGFPIPEITSPKSWSMFVVHPDDFNPATAQQYIDNWLQLTYEWKWGCYREWAYSQIPPNFVIEKLIDSPQVLARNIKVHCFHGRPVTLLVSDLVSSHNESVLEKYQPHELDAAAEKFGLDQHLLQRVLDMSAVLSEPTDFVRVDWMLSDKGIIFGEMTNYPSGGVSPPGPSLSLSADGVEDLYFSSWTLPVRYV